MIEIKKDIPLSRYTTFKIGGPAKFFTEVSTEEALLEAIKFAKEKKIAAFIMGGGSNLLVSDKGFDGLVIKIASIAGKQPQVKMKMENGNFFIECWAGESLASIVKLASDGSLSGLEWAAGIPGTIGGAIRGNAGAPWGCMGDNIESVKALNLDNLRVKEYQSEECQFEYRNSLFKKRDNLVILSAILKLKRGDIAEINEKIKGILEKRKKNQPQQTSPGSFFENPVVNNQELIDRFERDTGSEIKDNKNLYQHSGEIKLPAGWLIDEVGLRGKKIGQIQVSEKHANFLVNLGGGKAEEVVMLSSLIKQKVRDELGVELREEVKYVGF